METIATGTRISIKNILFATDFSAPSKAALPYALSIAAKYGSKLFPVNVIALTPFPSVSPTLAWEAVASQAAREAKDAMSGLEPMWHDIPHEVLIRKGDIWTELSHVIQEKEIDLIVTGTHGRTGLNRFVIGSVAEKIFRQASCPVLTIGPNVSANPKSVAEIHEILYPTDFSRHSLAVAPYAISLAQEHQARLSLLHVAENGKLGLSLDSLTVRLHELVPPEAELWCRPNAFIRYGVPEVEILELARERAADLIVMGVRPGAGLQAIASHFFWAIARRVVLNAHCPVLTIRG